MYTNGIPMGMASYVVTSDLTGHHYYTHMYILAIMYQQGNITLLSLYPLSFTKDTMSAKALTLPSTYMHGAFKHLGIHTYTYTMTGIDGIQWTQFR